MLTHEAAGDGVGTPEFVKAPLKDHVAAVAPGPRADVHDMVGDRHHVGIVLDDQDGISLIT